jgi:hypothetical protein
LGRRSRKRSAAPATKAAMSDRYARSREKDEAVRRSLEPLPKGERPGAVTAAALVALGSAIANVAAALFGESLGSNAVSSTILSTAILLPGGCGSAPATGR